MGIAVRLHGKNIDERLKRRLTTMVGKFIEPMGEAEMRRKLALLGPPPILTTENAKDFEVIFLEFAKCFKVRDMLMMDLTWHYAANSWFIRRNTRHSTIAIERLCRHIHENEEAKALYNKALYENKLQTLARKISRTPADVAEMAALEEKIANSVADVDGILAHTAAEIEQNRALQVNAEFQGNLDHLINSATRRRNDAYDLLERYSTGLGRAVKETFDKIVDAEFDEIENETKTEPETKNKDRPAITAAPSITATGDENFNDVEA
jgi:hypothetical protein